MGGKGSILGTILGAIVWAPCATADALECPGVTTNCSRRAHNHHTGDAGGSIGRVAGNEHELLTRDGGARIRMLMPD